MPFAGSHAIGADKAGLDAALGNDEGAASRWSPTGACPVGPGSRLVRGASLGAAEAMASSRLSSPGTHLVVLGEVLVGVAVLLSSAMGELASLSCVEDLPVVGEPWPCGR